ncbi:hypothetical protein PR202_ga05778 [Eleusine coracana subsp. coracana]|uniref:BED-type domain-containing protein n=1 Tax=Eleusine coracana subsp. coracana TaxID=191504 RepID=A0AAV5BWQ9_ELECO|nr:hypothetical protein PR202_ga05778 [Eleusine coracana subsp. coracana]
MPPPRAPTPASTPSTTETINVDSDLATPTASTSTRRGRKRTSKAWDDFDPVTEEVNGVTVTIGAICRHCKTRLSAISSNGTGHLLRHRATCLSKTERAARTQSILAFNPDGSVRSWEYDPDVARFELCCMIVALDLPLGIGASDAFERYIQRAHNPRFFHVSRQTTTIDFMKYFNECRSELLECLQSSVCSVALTTDIWSGKAKEDYISVIAHFF